MSLAIRISSAELEVMHVLWRAGRPVSFSEIRIELEKRKNWEKSTINTYIRRLADKGIIGVEEKNVKYYTPNVSEEEYVRAKEDMLINELYGGSAKRFVAALCDRGQLTEKDIDELKEYFKVGEGK